MGKRELEVFGKELLDVWSLDIVGLLELDDLEDLFIDWLVRRTSGGNQYYIRGLTGNGNDV